MNKNIDEEYKKSVEKDRKEYEKKQGHPLEANFATLISSMAIECLVFLGEIPNPITKKKEKNIGQARYLIDLLGILKEKTKGNLGADEANHLDNVLYELHTKFIAGQS